MKFSLKSITILFAASLAVSCSKEDILEITKPSVDFTFTGTNLPAPALVSFNSTSPEAITYFWEFGDGTVSSEKNPKHTYTSGGNYNVKLTVNSAKSSNSITKSITVLKALSTVKITKIEVVAIPSTNGILNWDSATDKPDIYVQLFDETGVSSLKSNTIWNFIPSIAIPFTVTFTTPLTTTNLTNTILKVQVWDDDSDSNSTGLNPDDKIGEVPFKIINYTTGTNKYPPFVTESVNGTLVTMHMTWE